MGHKVCFYEEVWQIIPKLSLLPPFYLEHCHSLFLTKKSTDKLEIYTTNKFHTFKYISKHHFNIFTKYSLNLLDNTPLTKLIKQ